jgi:hypothetical protein
MMKLASRSALRVRYNTATQQGAVSQKDALHTPTTRRCVPEGRLTRQSQYDLSLEQ